MSFSVAALAAWASLAHATPPDIFHSDVRPLCRGPRGVAVSMTTHFNHGSHYLLDTQWRLALVSPSESTVTYVDQGGMRQDWIDAEATVPELASPKISWSSGGGSMGATLQAWGMEDCRVPDGRHPLGAQPRKLSLSVDIAAGQLIVALDDRSKRVPVRFVDLRRSARDWQPLPEGTVSFDTLATWSQAEEPSEQGDLVLWWTDSHAVAFIELHDPIERTTLIAVADRAAMLRAHAWIVNAEGLELHRAKAFDQATDWFRGAVHIDPTFETAWFNLACAFAQRGYPAKVAEALEHLIDVPGMGAKVDADTDFAPVRASPELMAVRAKMKN